MRVVVTGGAGFIGANLCQALARRPEIDAVAAVDDLSTGRASNLAGLDDRVELITGSVLDTDLLHEVVSGADTLVHLAARPSVPLSVTDPVGAHDANATGTLRVLEAARAAGGVHTLVASSSSVYGDNPTLPKHEELPTAPLSPYAASKLATEAYARAYGASYDLPVATFRFFNVFGPLQPADHAYAAVIPSFVSAALAGRPVTIYGDGTQTRDFTSVSSVCAVLTRAVMERTCAAAPVNLAFGTRRSLLEVLEVLEDILGHPVARAHAAVRPGDVPHSQADTRRLDHLFPGLAPSDFRADLTTTVRWFERTTTVKSTSAAPR